MNKHIKKVKSAGAGICVSQSILVGDEEAGNGGNTTYLDQDTFTIQLSPLKKNKNKINVGMKDEAFASLDI